MEDKEYEIALSMIKNNDDPMCKAHLDFLLKKCKDNNLNIGAVDIIKLALYDCEYYDMCVSTLNN